MSDLKRGIDQLIAENENADPGIQALFGNGAMITLIKFIVENWDLIKEIIESFGRNADAAGIAHVDWLKLLRYLSENWHVIVGLYELLNADQGPSASV